MTLELDPGSRSGSQITCMYYINIETQFTHRYTIIHIPQSAKSDSIIVKKIASQQKCIVSNLFVGTRFIGRYTNYAEADGAQTTSISSSTSSIQDSAFLKTPYIPQVYTTFHNPRSSSFLNVV
jgi:hypothetical protein